jgi:putative ABC transport system permease protein
MHRDFLRIAVGNILHRKLRSWLTVLGIVIGVGAIVALLLISAGLENAIVDQFNQAGSNRIYIYPKAMIAGSFASDLTEDDVHTVESMPGVEWVQPYKSRPSEIEFDRVKEFANNLFSIPVQGLETRAADNNMFDLEAGRLFSSGDKYSAVVGWYIAHNTFDVGTEKHEIRVNNNMLIAGQRFKVIGILAYKGTDDDKNIFIPEDTIKLLFPDIGEEVMAIEVKLSDGVDPDTAAARIKTQLERKRDDENFEVMTPENLLKTLQSILSIIQIVLGSIAAISLVVGGIGIANSMFTSVLERTKEIGIMKSIGARNGDILTIFLIGAALLGTFGGLFGVSVGIGAALIVENIAKQAGFGLLKIIVTWKVVTLGLLFASFVGMIAGAIPARRASRLRPVDALRG